MAGQSYGKKPTTSAGKRLSIAHLQMQNKLDMKKIRDHDKQAAQGVDEAYNKAHSKNHKKELKARQKYIKKAMKLKVKASKK